MVSPLVAKKYVTTRVQEIRAVIWKRLKDNQRHVAAGQLLLLTMSVVIAGCFGLLRPTPSDWVALGSITVAMLAVLLVSLRINWSRLSALAGLIFPAVALAAMGTLGHFTRPEISTSFIGLFVLCFAYTGAFQPRHAEFLLLPIAWPSYVATVGTWNSGTAIRLGIVSAIWIMLSEVLASLIHQHLRVSQHWERTALIDDLTQVGNRRSIERRLAEVLTGDVLVMCDLDHFKALNDVAGHAAGDEVLRDFGAIIRGCLRGDDYVGRYGGEEFVLVLAETKLADVDDVLRRVRRRFQRLHPTVTFSAGYAGHDDTHSAEQTLSEADAALYIAKDHGRDRFVASVTDIVRA